MSEATAQSGLSDNAAGALAYVTFIPAIIFLIVEPYNRNSYIRFHSWQSIFLNIGVFAIDVVLGMIPVFGWMILPFFQVGCLIVWVLVIVRALKGERFRLPFIGDLAVRQAGV